MGLYNSELNALILLIIILRYRISTALLFLIFTLIISYSLYDLEILDKLLYNSVNYAVYTCFYTKWNYIIAITDTIIIL